MKWKSIFIVIFIMLVLGACNGSEVQAGAEWLREPDLRDINNERNTYIDIPRNDVYEVTASKIDLAIMELEQTSISELSPELATWYTGHYYKCPADKQPYLVRAVVGHAGTGAFTLERLDDDLLIVHRSLGHSTIYQKSALVVNLDYEPDQIYVRVVIAE
jgi:hypothetical protein